MTHSYSIEDEVHPQGQEPQPGRPSTPRATYTIIKCMPIEGDGRIRYRIRSSTDNCERVVFEDELSRLG
jgi:hypothetical protein